MIAAPYQPNLGAVVALPGGPSRLAQPARTSLDLSRAAAGVSVKAVRHLQQHMRLTNREMSEVLSISESTLTRREQTRSNLTRAESEKAIQLSVVVAKGLEVFENEPDFHRGLQRENPALGGERPQALRPPAWGRERVRAILGRIQWAIFSRPGLASHCSNQRMRFYCFGEQPHSNDLTGQGSRYHSGRWYQQGPPILYTAEHLSLAKLELLANSPVLPTKLLRAHAGSARRPPRPSCWLAPQP